MSALWPPFHARRNKLCHAIACHDSTPFAVDGNWVNWMQLEGFEFSNPVPLSEGEVTWRGDMTRRGEVTKCFASYFTGWSALEGCCRSWNDLDFLPPETAYNEFVPPKLWRNVPPSSLHVPERTVSQKNFSCPENLSNRPIGRLGFA